MKTLSIALALLGVLGTVSLASASHHTRRAADTSTRLDASEATGVEVGTDGEVRRMVSFAREVVITAPRPTEKVWACDVVELAQGNGMVRRCSVVEGAGK